MTWYPPRRSAAMVSSVNTAVGAAASIGTANSRGRARTLHSILAFKAYAENHSLVDCGGRGGGGAERAPQRLPAAYAWRAECRSLLGARREAAHLPKHAASLRVRPD